MMRVYLAGPDNLPGIIPLCRSYFEGSGYSRMTYSEERTKDMLLSIMQRGAVLIAVEKMNIVGFATVEFFYSNFEEQCASVGLFYVAETHRGTGISRQLGEAICQLVDANSVTLTYAMSNSRNSDKNRKLFNNLFAKLGFEDKGSLLTRIK